MGRQFDISDMGLKLIKAYEGFRPVDRTLVSGQRVVGYGHRLMDDKSVMLSKEEAENLLKDDLAPFIDMINENVHAPLSQSQFDALVSFAYNIGPKAFLKSDTLRALNNGRPLDAANGFDIWRKSEIDGKTYVVDALMRRRTAEKALFLRPEGRPVSASATDLPPIQDDTVALLRTEDALPVFTSEEAAGVVSATPYSASRAEQRRREDNAAGSLMYSEVFSENDEFEDAAEDTQPFDLELDENEFEAEEESSIRPSLIAVEDAKLKDRLNALIEDVKTDQKITDTEQWPESLIQAEESTENVIPFKVENDNDVTVSKEEKSDQIVIDNLAEDDALRIRTEDSASRFIDLDAADDASEEKTSSLPYFLMMVMGSTLFGGGIAAWLKSKGAMFGEYGPVLTMCGIFIGGMMLLGALYYAARQTFKTS
jgi:GH24 family phage-related lysozyme (muramidase)